MDFEKFKDALALALGESVTGGQVRVWTYRPPIYRPRGKRYTLRERLRRRRFYEIPPTITITRDQFR